MTRKAKSLPVAAETTALSGYRIVWLFVLFDLPVLTKKQRKAATRFRKDLLNLGFAMSQFSVYLKFCAGKEQAEAICRKVEAAMPSQGKVHIVAITDKQYENIRTYRGMNREPGFRNADQLALF
ncbi:MAG TPA: CRISPR-associated endonuclease Cas2 [Alphaproteobacteria bacterium]|nr:CRISPR-associated endonuclease Cas2 [Alphaproteobacteria bacterium]